MGREMATTAGDDEGEGAAGPDGLASQFIVPADMFAALGVTHSSTHSELRQVCRFACHTRRMIISSLQLYATGRSSSPVCVHPIKSLG